MTEPAARSAAASAVSAVTAVLVVPNGTSRPEPLAAAVRANHPSWSIAIVWAGDPHRRPVLGDGLGEELADGLAEGLAWYDEEGELDPSWQRTLASLEPLDAEWLRLLKVSDALFAARAGSVVGLWVGAVAVLGAIEDLVAPSGSGVDAVIVARASGPLPDDGLVPTEAELIRHGSYSPHVIGLTQASSELRTWLGQRLRESSVHADGPRIGPILERAAAAFDVIRCDDPAIGAGPWRWDVASPRLVDLPRFEPARPWVLDATEQHQARIRVPGDPHRQDVLTRAVAQLAGHREPLVLPGAIAVDSTIRALVSGADPPPPAPWSAAGAFRTWLEPLYWPALHESSRQLGVAFPNPLTTDAERYRDWCRGAFVTDGISLVLRAPDPHIGQWLVGDHLSTAGVNVVGYFTRELGLGDVARRIAAGLELSGVHQSLLACERSASPHVPAHPVLSTRVAHATTLAIVNADQLPALYLDHPELFAARTRMIGYWFWELEFVPTWMRAAASSVDEIWAGSAFVADALAAAVDTPVRHVPIPVGPPIPAERDRASFPVLAPFVDRFVFAVVLDHFSVTERKNPVGAIEAFRRAFAANEGPVLIVKSMNARHRWPQHEQVVAAAGDRPDIVVWDEHLERADHMAFIRSVDVLVSLHRSEGLGLHLAEAMWLGTPVIATRYSGNLDLMDDDSAALVDFTLIPVERGAGAYPPEARWADPDLEQAAQAMRDLAADASRVARLARAARSRMERQPTLLDTGRTIAELLGVPTADSDPGRPGPGRPGPGRPGPGRPGPGGVAS
jgi:glycosyltransferase involved in cell wall biosynthesis